MVAWEVPLLASQLGMWPGRSWSMPAFGMHPTKQGTSQVLAANAQAGKRNVTQIRYILSSRVNSPEICWERLLTSTVGFQRITGKEADGKIIKKTIRARDGPAGNQPFKADD